MADPTLEQALALLKSLAAPHETQKDGDHAWRECRACLAAELLSGGCWREGQSREQRGLALLIAEYERLAASVRVQVPEIPIDVADAIEGLHVSIDDVEVWLDTDACPGQQHDGVCLGEGGTVADSLLDAEKALVGLRVVVRQLRAKVEA